MSKLRELTEEEKKKPYSKYYYEKPVKAEPEKYEIASGKPVDPSMAMLPEDRNRLLGPGIFEAEIGFCQLPEGGAYVANRTIMPDVTPEMINWWFAWHALEDLRYMIWFPPSHFAVSVSDKDREKITDPSVPMAEKHYGVVHHVVEDIGGGAENIDIHFLSPGDFGFDMDRFHAGASAFAGGFGFSKSIDAPEDQPPAPAIMCHLIRETDEGIEFRTRFWLGYIIENRSPKCMLPEGAQIPEQAARGLLHHNIEEYANLARLLPRLYAEEKDEPFV
ncbi:MAG: hypothetical protein K9J79_06255 [Desulfobacteraceae bacterium]|nr:hypothetical protein [Desulfobacteraceae bacterium]